MKGQIFRIAHLGYFDFADLFAIVAALEIILHAKGIPVEFGSGVAAAQRVYAEAAIGKEGRPMNILIADGLSKPGSKS